MTLTHTNDSQDLTNLISSCKSLTAVWQEHHNPIRQAILDAKDVPCSYDAEKVVEVRFRLEKKLLIRRFKNFPGGRRPLARHHLSLLYLRIVDDTTAWTDRFCEYFTEHQMMNHTTDISTQARIHSHRPMAQHEEIRVIHASYIIRRYVAMLALERFRLTRRLPPELAEATSGRLYQMFVADVDGLDEDLAGFANALNEIAAELYSMPPIEAKLIEDVGDAISRLGTLSSVSLGIIGVTNSTDEDSANMDFKEIAEWGFALAEIMFVSGLPVTGCYCGTVYSIMGSIPGEMNWD